MTLTTSSPRPPTAQVTWSAQWHCASCRDGCDAYEVDHDCAIAQ
ncbi:hypothetical protein [Kitasatospora mediocidica]|nr:hypothetical protein [Kitasatospora mediocidica]